MWNPTSANLICDFIKMVLHHKHISTFSFGKAISVNSSDTCEGVFICLVSQIKYLLFWKGGARPTHETETFTESCSRKNCSEKFLRFYRKEYVILEKSFLDKLQPVSFKLKLHRRCFLMIFPFIHSLINFIQRRKNNVSANLHRQKKIVIIIIIIIIVVIIIIIKSIGSVCLIYMNPNPPMYICKLDMSIYGLFTA